MHSISKKMSALKKSISPAAPILVMLVLINFASQAQEGRVQDELFSPPATISTEGVPSIHLSEVKSLLYDSSALKNNLIWDTDQKNRKLLVTDATNDIYDVESPLAAPVKLTEKSSPLNVKTNPSGKTFAYNSDNEKGDRYQLVVS